MKLRPPFPADLLDALLDTARVAKVSTKKALKAIDRIEAIKALPCSPVRIRMMLAAVSDLAWEIEEAGGYFASPEIGF